MYIRTRDEIKLYMTQMLVFKRCAKEVRETRGEWFVIRLSVPQNPSLLLWVSACVLRVLMSHLETSSRHTQNPSFVLWVSTYIFLLNYGFVFLGWVSFNFWNDPSLQLRGAMCCGGLQAVCCSMLRCVAVEIRPPVARRSVLQWCIAVGYSALQSVAGICVLQCAASSALQCAA